MTLSHVAQLKARGMPFDGFEHLTLDASGVQLAHALSVTDWHDWLPQAKPPFEQCTITLNPRHYLAAEELDPEGTADAIVFMIKDEVVTSAMFWGKTILPGPFASHLSMSWKPGIWPSDSLGDRGAPLTIPDEVVYGWGSGYLKTFEVPLYPFIDRSPAAEYKKLPPDLIFNMLEQCAGQVRVILAVLAMINRQHPAMQSEPLQRTGRALYKGRSLPNWAPRLVVLRPDAPRAPAAPETSGTGTPKRDHSVRRHLRRYKSGRTVWVRSHRRGDEALGTVEKTYLIEADPNKGLHNGPPEGAS